MPQVLASQALVKQAEPDERDPDKAEVLFSPEFRVKGTGSVGFRL